MKEPVELYLDLYKEYRLEIRHQESQRSTVSTICVAFAGALIGLSFQDKLIPVARPYLGLLLINFSLVAILMLRKLYERFALGRERAKLFLQEIDKCLQKDTSPKPMHESAAGPLESIWEEGRRWGERRYPFITFVRLHRLWESLLIGSVLVGVALFIGSGDAGQCFINSLNLPPALSAWAHGHARRCLWFVALSGPVIQFLLLYVYQRWEESKFKEITGWDARLNRIFRRVHRSRRPAH